METQPTKPVVNLTANQFMTLMCKYIDQQGGEIQIQGASQMGKVIYQLAIESGEDDVIRVRTHRYEPTTPPNQLQAIVPTSDVVAGVGALTDKRKSRRRNK